MNNKKIVITIGREYGSGGHAIAELIAKQLDIPLYDRNILALASSETGIEENELLDGDERVINPFFEPYFANRYDFNTVSDKLYLTQAKIIREKASEGSCIFVGRCSDYVLADTEDCYHFFIWAPKAARIARIMKEEDIKSEAAAEKILKMIDRQRKSYYQLYTDRKWGSYIGKDMVINSSTLGIAGTAQLIIDFVNKVIN
ncbi:cytidylate kinase-like family protein [Hespellia stercorisuis]|uniref:Cytidylate kinase n=1 Tax=Hespellia stercorisuis DSM 15480 TaxID=1121950 RepID=A0A1M6JTE7_9FIRM|nr:cytidylate kinase-like family protein [Hespellia stercorisuis]SHJ49963.1 Cytidylate kinase [Hespellia stercorisuis DSM 15480]